MPGASAAIFEPGEGKHELKMIEEQDKRKLVPRLSECFTSPGLTISRFILHERKKKIILFKPELFLFSQIQPNLYLVC